MRMEGVVLLAPASGFRPQVIERLEPVRIEQLLSDLVVEALDEGIVGRLPRRRELQLDLVPIGPLIEQD